VIITSALAACANARAQEQRAEAERQWTAESARVASSKSRAANASLRLREAREGLKDAGARERFLEAQLVVRVVPLPPSPNHNRLPGFLAAFSPSTNTFYPGVCLLAPFLGCWRGDGRVRTMSGVMRPRC
jgi:hypothetical protein